MSEEEKNVQEPDAATEESVEPSPLDVLGAEAFEQPTDEELFDDEAETEQEESEPTAPTEEASTTTTEGETEKKGDAEAKAAESTEETAPTLVPYKVKYGGQEFDIKVTAEQAAVLDAQNKSAQQFPHLQGKYTDLKKQIDEAAQVAASKSPGQSPAQDFAPEDFLERMDPLVNDYVKRGAISAEFKEMYPMEAANYAWASVQLQQITDALGPVVQRYAQDAQDHVRQTVKAEIHGGMAAIAAENPEFYGDLSDQQAREAFFDHLVELNVDVGLLRSNPKEVLQKLWGSYQGPKLIEAARIAQEQARASQAEKRVVSGGGGGGGGARQPANDPLADIKELFRGGR